MKDLEKGKKYKYRVRAQNLYGTSDPAQTDKATEAKNPYGMCEIKYYFMPRI